MLVGAVVVSVGKATCSVMDKDAGSGDGVVVVSFDLEVVDPCGLRGVGDGLDLGSAAVDEGDLVALF